MAVQMITNEFKFVTYQRLHTVPRDGQIQRLPWNELTDAERESIQQSERRAAYVDQFDIYA